MTTIKERIKKFIEHIGTNVRQFETSCNLGVNILNGNPTGSIRSDTLAKILSYYPMLNADWLLTGKGKMVDREVGYDDSKFLQVEKAREHATIQINGDTYNSIKNVVNFVHDGKISPSDYCSNVLYEHIARYRSTFNSRLEEKKDWRAI